MRTPLADGAAAAPSGSARRDGEAVTPGQCQETGQGRTFLSQVLSSASSSGIAVWPMPGYTLNSTPRPRELEGRERTRGPRGAQTGAPRRGISRGDGGSLGAPQLILAPVAKVEPDHLVARPMEPEEAPLLALSVKGEVGRMRSRSLSTPSQPVHVLCLDRTRARTPRSHDDRRLPVGLGDNVLLGIRRKGQIGREAGDARQLLGRPRQNSGRGRAGICMQCSLPPQPKSRHQGAQCLRQKRGRGSLGAPLLGRPHLSIMRETAPPWEKPATTTLLLGTPAASS